MSPAAATAMRAVLQQLASGTKWQPQGLGLQLSLLTMTAMDAVLKELGSLHHAQKLD